MVCRNDRRRRGSADIRRRGDRNAVYVNSEYPGTGEHEKSVDEDPDKCAEDKGRGIGEPGNLGSRAHTSDKDVNQRGTNRR